MSDASKWRTESRRIIEETIDTALEHEPALREDLKALFALVFKAYPFGPRKWHPYKIFLDEVRRARDKITPRGTGPIDRFCPACGAKRGRKCRPIGAGDEVAELLAISDEADRFGKRRIAVELRDDAFHDARRDVNGPLFGQPPAAEEAR